MHLLQSIALGIVEGFTEFLPISSTAHLLITSRWFRIQETIFSKSFVVIIQFGAILSVVTLYFKRFIRDWETNKRIIVAFIPTALVGLGLYKIIKGFLFESQGVVAAALTIGGIGLILFELYHKESKRTDLSKMSYLSAFFIGCVQAISVIPGVSRAGATIVGGMLAGLHREAAVEFSFLLAVPTIAAASGYDLLQTSANFTRDEFFLLIVGFVASFIFGTLGIKFLISVVKHRTLLSFGIYRIILGAILLALMIW